MTNRRRGSEDSRSRLLEAATRLFADHGYEQTTVRQIGEHADVDPALIARYFGSKAALYVEALRPEKATGKPVDLASPAAVQRFLDRIAPKGPTPALHAAIRPHADPELQSTAMSLLRNRLLDPFEHRATESELDNPQLRSELVVAAIAGIIISRTSGAFPELASASTADVGTLIADLIASLVD
ncbi:MAG: TetR family transcriptional regulator [Marmoricola sp.]